MSFTKSPTLQREMSIKGSPSPARKSISEFGGVESLNLQPLFLEFCKRTNIHPSTPVENMGDYVSEILKLAGDEITSLRLNSSDVQSKYENAVHEYRLALNVGEDIRVLKSKLLHSVERARIGKEEEIKLRGECDYLTKTVEVLSGHLEHLMSQMKREAASKHKLLTRLEESRVTVTTLKRNYVDLLKQRAGMKRYIGELNAGTVLLSDQLRLMDAKFLVLRGKLDYARDYGTRRVNEADRACADMRRVIENLKLQYPNISIPSVSLTSPSRTSPSSRASAEGGIFTPVRSKSAKASAAGSPMNILRSHTAGGGVGGGGRSKGTSFDSLPTVTTPRLSAPGGAGSASTTSGDDGISLPAGPAQEEDRLLRVVDKIKKREQLELMSTGKRVWTESDMRQLVK